MTVTNSIIHFLKNNLLTILLICAIISIMVQGYPTQQAWPTEARFLQNYVRIYETGIASWYGDYHHGMTMANGKPFDMHALSIAHKSLPFGTKVRITNVNNSKQIDLIVTDRGPYIKGRVVDLSYAAAKEIGMVGAGIVPCIVEVIRG